MIDCLYCRREKEVCDNNPCETKVKQLANREQGYYWAFWQKEWYIVYYVKEENIYLVHGTKNKAVEKDFELIGITQITKPK